MKKVNFFLTILLSGVTLGSFAQPGALDSTFGTNGIVITPVNHINSMIIQPDGKIVGVGSTSINLFESFLLVRYNTNGTIDSGFGIDGKATAAPTSGGEWGYAVAIQPDGKIIAAGHALNDNNDDFELIRFHMDGTIDSSFGSDGKVITSISNYDFIYSVAIQSDGKIVALGTSDIGGLYDIALVRYDSDGELDSSFSTDGIVTTPIDSAYLYEPYSMALQKDGKIIVARDFMIKSFALVRYNVDGTLDSSFGTDGIVTTDIGFGTSGAQDITIQPDGKIIAAGRAYIDQSLDFALVRYYTDGSLDNSFGTSGIVTTDIEGRDEAYMAVLQVNGKIIAVGTSNFPNPVYTLVRYNSNGSLDSSFGTDGKVTTLVDSDAEFTYTNSAEIQVEGKIVVAGRIDDSSGAVNFILARYLTDLTTGIINCSSPQTSAFIYPNPIQSTEVFQYTLTNDEVLTLSL